MSGSWATDRLNEVAIRKAELFAKLDSDDERISAYRAALRQQNLRGGRFTDRLAEEVANILDNR